MELLVSAELVKGGLVAPLQKEADELLSIIVASIKTARNKQ
jgi:hypothetical protein